MISALVACSAPMTSYASELKLVQKGEGYAVFVGQSSECGQVIKDICENLENGNIFCPNIPILPDTTAPDAPSTPDTALPSTPAQPDITLPDAPVLPDVTLPDTGNPDAPASPDGAPVQPDIQEPDAPSEDGFHSYAIQILNLVNAERAKAGLSALKLDADITAAANVRAKEITQSFSHTRPDGSSFSSVLTQQGISYRRSGENIAWGQKTPEQVMSGWMHSDGHRANILNANFENIGIGYYQDENGVNYWVQLFTT